MWSNLLIITSSDLCSEDLGLDVHLCVSQVTSKIIADSSLKLYPTSSTIFLHVYIAIQKVFQFQKKNHH